MTNKRNFLQIPFYLNPYNDRDNKCCQTYSHRETWFSLCIDILFYLKKLASDQWIRKWWYIYTMEYYSAINQDEFESVLMR